jgi:hypothetical protein
MARTNRKYSTWCGYSREFMNQLKRGLVPHEIGDIDSYYGEAATPKGKRGAKKRKRRHERLKAEKYIREHLDDLNL